MSRKRIAIAGAGTMARSRGRAFLETGRAQICAIASRHTETAQRCAEELGCIAYHDDYRRLGQSQPDAILIEVPHKPQDEIALWALEAGYDLLIGGVLAGCLDNGLRIRELATRHGRVVEVGFQRRYQLAWQEMRRLIREGELGEPVMALSSAFWNAEPDRWYYDQEASGGMPLTHLSYCHLNAIRWILGRPTVVCAMANRKVQTGPTNVVEESCGALVEFDGSAFASVTAGYIAPEGMTDPEPRFICTRGGVEPNAASSPSGITVFARGGPQVRSFADEPAPFVRQAHAFLDAIESRHPALNPPEDALLDIQIADAISLSAREHRMVKIEHADT